MTNPSLLDEWDVEIPTTPDPEKTYVGRRIHHGRVLVTVCVAGEERALAPCGGDQRSVGFEWGYNGAGPSALAAAILADHLGYGAPIDLVIAYRRSVVSRLRSDGWAITSSDLSAWLGQNLPVGRP